MSNMPRTRQVKFVTILSWMLKHKFLQQVHTSVYLLWPWPSATELAALLPRGAHRGPPHWSVAPEETTPAQQQQQQQHSGDVSFTSPTYGAASPTMHTSGSATSGTAGSGAGAGLHHDDDSPRARADTHTHTTPTGAGAPGTPGTPSSVAGTSVPWTPREQAYLAGILATKPAVLGPLCRRLATYLRDTLITLGGACAEGDARSAGVGVHHDPSGAVDAEGDAEAESQFGGGGGGGGGGGSHRHGGSSSHNASATGGTGAAQADPALQLALRLEELMWRLRVSRHDLQAVLAQFPELFVVCA